MFLDPETPHWQIGPEGYAAEGLWSEIAGRVCGEIGRLAALQARPVVGSVQILGDADPIDYGLPQEYRRSHPQVFSDMLALGGSIHTAFAPPWRRSQNMIIIISERIPRAGPLWPTASGLPLLTLCF